MATPFDHLVELRRRLRVLLVVEQLRRRVPGGVGTYARSLVSGLVGLAEPLPVEVVLFASGYRRRQSRSAESVEESGNGGDPLWEFGLAVEESKLSSRLLTRAWDHDLIAAPKGFSIVHSVSMAFPKIRSSRRDDVTGREALVVSVHDLAWRRLLGSTTRRGRSWHEGALRRAIRSAQALVVPSDEVARDLSEAGVREDRIRVITEGADHLPAPDIQGARSLLADHGVDGEYILSVGTLEPRKNLARLIDAHAIASTRLGGGVRLVVVGPRGWGPRDVVDRSTSYSGLVKHDRTSSKTASEVVYLGGVAAGTLAGLYALARTFVYVPLAEGYGLPPLEAMRSSVPVVVSSEVPSVKYRIGDCMPGDETDPRRRVALSVNPIDVEEIADAIVVASSDEVIRHELIGAARQMVSKRTWKRCALEHVDIWESFR